MAIDLNIKGISDKIKSKLPGQATVSLDDPPPETPADSRKIKPPLSANLAGEKSFFAIDLKPYLPSELVGGSIPHVPGLEDEAVWNAASQACATEKVHFVYTVEGGRIWYLACPSNSLASSPDSWCPLAAALPGNSEYWDRETVYMYEQEGNASALRWDHETNRMQIYLGASRTILPRIQSMEANFVTINPQVAKPVPWNNRQLMTERLSRATARMLLVVGIVTALGLLGVMAGQYILTALIDRKLETVKQQSENASNEIMAKAMQSTQSEVLAGMVRLQSLLDDLSKIDGTLVKYEVKGTSIMWEALVPAAYSTGVMSVRGQAQPGIEPDGRIRLKGSS
ncbi:MAG: hypothetical protein DI586_10455 [Micavibrio aeruginosavorus]|uniref:Uncharacterized protein n=1 Tax=Micavibrio aeruginosavorus TaxID=349221 RepID=A0A2W5FJP9_9BACT|nr:MAG: hypothetical protein DI586_10455 [Micavibrio aeruginosavorus]